MERPFVYTAEGRLLSDGKKIWFNPACRPGSQQADELTAVGDFRRSSTNEAAAVLAPIYLPSWGHLARLCDFFRLKGQSRPLAKAKTARADSYKQFSLAE